MGSLTRYIWEMRFFNINNNNEILRELAKLRQLEERVTNLEIEQTHFDLRLSGTTAERRAVRLVKVRQLRQKGRTIAAMAEELGVSEATINNDIKSLKVWRKTNDKTNKTH